MSLTTHAVGRTIPIKQHRTPQLLDLVIQRHKVFRRHHTTITDNDIHHILNVKRLTGGTNKTQPTSGRLMAGIKATAWTKVATRTTIEIVAHCHRDSEDTDTTTSITDATTTNVIDATDNTNMYQTDTKDERGGTTE